MSMAPSRIAAAGGMTIGGVPTVIRIRASEETGLTYGIPLVAIAQDTPAEDCSITIDWGDGTVKTYPVNSTRKYTPFTSSDHKMTHTYALPGVYRVTVDGRATDIMLGSNYAWYKTYAGMVEAVEQWGSSIRLGSVLLYDRGYVGDLARSGYVASFRACANLTYIAPVTFDAVCPYAFTGSPIRDIYGMTMSSTVVYSYAFSESAVTGTLWWPSGQTTVPIGCFFGAKSLEDLEGMESVTKAEGDAFNGCSALTSLDGLSSLASAGSYAFNGCSALTSLDGLSSLVSAGGHCFAGCTSLARFDKLDQYGVPMQSMALTTLGIGCFEGCTALTSLVSLPHLVTELPESCFEGCTGLKNISIPGQVLTIRAHAFRNCKATYVAFYEPEITSGPVWNSTLRRAARNATPTLIDQAAFIGQAESGEFYAPGMTAEQICAIKGAPSYSSGETFDSTNPLPVSWYKFDAGSRVESKDWFECDNPTFAPWGLGKSWEIRVGSDYRRVDHNSIICADFLAEPGDNAPPVNGSTRLERLEAAKAYNVGGVTYSIEPQFSPYMEEYD